jgi:hypothetical protein
MCSAPWSVLSYKYCAKWKCTTREPGVSPGSGNGLEDSAIGGRGDLKLSSRQKRKSEILFHGLEYRQEEYFPKKNPRNNICLVKIGFVKNNSRK